MKRRISLLLAALSAVTMFQLATPAPAAACADPNCPWSPVTDYVGRTLYWARYYCNQTVGESLDPNPCYAP